MLIFRPHLVWFEMTKKERERALVTFYARDLSSGSRGDSLRKVAQNAKCRNTVPFNLLSLFLGVLCMCVCVLRLLSLFRFSFLSPPFLITRLVGKMLPCSPFTPKLCCATVLEQL